MRRRCTVLIAAASAAVLCLGTYEVAVATSPRPNAVSATSGLGACATAAGYLRLVDGSAHCPTGYLKVAVAQSSSAPRAMALKVSSGTPSKTLSLLGGLTATGSCSFDGDIIESRLRITPSATMQLDGTTFVSKTATGSAFLIDNSAHSLPNGAGSVFSATKTDFLAQVAEGQQFATINAHLIVTVPGAVHRIDFVLDANSYAPYCRMSAQVSQAVA